MKLDSVRCRLDHFIEGLTAKGTINACNEVDGAPVAFEAVLDYYTRRRVIKESKG